jgi:ABC-2 type transport system permease protein
MFRYAFRLHRWGMTGFGAILALNTLLQGASYTKIAGTTRQSRAHFAEQMTAIGQQYTYLVPLPHQADTLAGWVLYKAWSAFPILVAIWAIAAATGAVRGDEEKLLVESWIAARVSRARLVATRLAAFAVAAAVVAAAAGVGTLAGAAGVESIGLDHVAGQAVALWLLTVTLFALCFLVAQLPGSKRAAQGAAAGLVLVLFVIAGAARSNHALDGISWISPFRWFDGSYPLTPAGRLDTWGLALSATTTIVAGGLALFLFQLRDVGGPVFRVKLPQRAAREAPVSPLIRTPVARLLYRQRWMLLTWTLAMALMAVYMTSITRQIIDNLLALPGMRAFLTQGTSDPYQGFVALFWFSIAQLLIAGFAIHLVSTWASDDGEGVLAAELSRPRRRWMIVLERFAEATVGILLVAVLGSLVATLSARSVGTTLDIAGMTRATLLLMPFALSFTAIGAVGSVWWPRASVGVLGGLVFLSYLIYDIGPLLQWPDWATKLSPFALYGTPLLTGVYWNGLYAMVAIVLGGFAAATYLMRRRELAG